MSMQAAAAPSTPAPKTAGLTKYVVLFSADGTSFKAVANIAASNADKAIRRHAATGSDVAPASGLFVAVSARNWRPVKVTTETTTTLKLEEAK